MAYRSAAEQPRKKKFAGGLMFLAFFIAMCCVIYLPWDQYLPIKPDVPTWEQPQEQAPAAPPPAQQSVVDRIATERYGSGYVETRPDAAWYNDTQLFMKAVASLRATLASSTVTLVVLVGFVLPFSLFFFIK